MRRPGCHGQATIIVAGVVSVLSVVTLRQQLAGTGADAGTITVAGQTLVAFDCTLFQAQLAKAQARVRELEERLEGLK